MNPVLAITVIMAIWTVSDFSSPPSMPWSVSR
jgi:hypothetical protein